MVGAQINCVKLKALKRNKNQPSQIINIRLLLFTPKCTIDTPLAFRSVENILYSLLLIISIYISSFILLSCLLIYTSTQSFGTWLTS